MATWKADTVVLRNKSGDFTSITGELTRISRDIKNVGNLSGLSFSGKSVMQARINELSNAVVGRAANTRKMGEQLSTIANLYEKCEKSIIERESFTEKKSKEKNPFEWKWKDTWKIIAEAGPVGSLAAAFGNIITGDGDIKSYLDAAKALNKMIGSGATAVSKLGTSASWKYWVGLNSKLEGLNTSTKSGIFTSTFKKEFDLGFNGKDAAAKIKTGTKWGGYALTGLVNLTENVQEMKETGTSWERAISETVVETAVDIGIGALATSAATTLLASVGAPALAVGAGAVLITWAANGVCKWVTGGKDLGEVAADFVCDINETVMNAAYSAGEAMAEGVKAVGKAVTGFFDNISVGWKSIFA